MSTQKRTVSAKIVRLREISCGVYKATAPGTSVYTGPYRVTPEFFSQTLETRGKRMGNNVTVEAITVSRTSNLSGGKTIYIGGLING